MAKHKFENGYNPLDEIKDKILKRDIPGARFLEIDRIIVREQVRKTFTDESINELADSIREFGLLNPLTVKRQGNDFLLISGERRLRALKSLGETNAQVIERDIKDEDIPFIQIIENAQREDVPPLELAEIYKELRDKYNLSLRDIAKKVGKSHSHVIRTIKLLDLPDYIKNDITVEHGVPPSKALEISKLDKKMQKTVLENPDNFSREDLRNLRKEKVEIKKDIDEISTFDLNTEDQDTENPEDGTEEQNPNSADQEPEVEIQESKTLRTEDQTAKNLEDSHNTEKRSRNLNTEDQLPAEIDKLTREFNSMTGNIRIKNIGFQAISIWSAKPEVLMDIIYGLKKKYCK